MEDKIPVEYLQVLCPCCKGKKYQYNKQTGMKVPCPCCQATGLQSPPAGPIEIIENKEKDNGKRI